MVEKSYDGSCKWNMSQESKQLEKHVMSSFRIESEKNRFKEIIVE